MHSPALDAVTARHVARDIVNALDTLDRVSAYVELHHWQKLRTEMVDAYLDLIRIVNQPYDQDADL